MEFVYYVSYGEDKRCLFMYFSGWKWVRACRGARFHSLLSLSGDGYEGRRKEGRFYSFFYCVCFGDGWICTCVYTYM